MPLTGSIAAFPQQMAMSVKMERVQRPGVRDTQAPQEGVRDMQASMRCLFSALR